MPLPTVHDVRIIMSPLHGEASHRPSTRSSKRVGDRGQGSPLVVVVNNRKFGHMLGRSHLPDGLNPGETRLEGWWNVRGAALPVGRMVVRPHCRSTPPHLSPATRDRSPQGWWLKITSVRLGCERWNVA